MPTTPVSGLAYNDLNAGYSERFAHDGSSVTRNVETAWSTRQTFLSEMLGWSYLTGDIIHRVLPDEHPDLPGFWATAVDTISPLKPNAAAGSPDFHSFDNIQYSVNYQPLPFDVLDDAVIDSATDGEMARYVERKFAASGENLPFGFGKFAWTSDGKPLNVPPVKIFPIVKMDYIWRRVPRIPWININKCLGRVNSISFDRQATKWGVPSGGFDVGTVLFLGADPVELLNHETAIFGTPDAPAQWDIHYKFMFRPNRNNAGTNLGWNYFWRPGASGGAGGNFELATHDGTAGGNKMYQEENFGLLFRLF